VLAAGEFEERRDEPGAEEGAADCTWATAAASVWAWACTFPAEGMERVAPTCKAVATRPLLVEVRASREMLHAWAIALSVSPNITVYDGGLQGIDIEG